MLVEYKIHYGWYNTERKFSFQITPDVRVLENVFF